MKTLIVIPARLASSRLPEKMLLSETGMPLIQHTYIQATKSRLADKVVVATDHQRIQEVVDGFGGEVVMTDPDCPSGSDRVAEVCRKYEDYQLFCNVQGDEPEIEPEVIDKAIAVMKETPNSDSSAPAMSTLATPIRQLEKLEDPNCVKVVWNKLGQAKYFSRSVIPHPRQFEADMLNRNPAIFFQHIGIYVYRREFLLQWPSLPPCELEEIEKLEQLRVLDAGYQIAVDVVEESRPGIDTREDYEAFVSRWENC